ncbi:MAG TPA: hypothetical protein VF755_18835 [Catenuloplanes sp.]|jgi:hypothetical protein
MQTTHAAHTAAAPGIRTTGWLLAVPLVIFVIWFAAAMTMLSSAGVANSADLTPAQMSTVRTGWLVIWPLYALALLVGLVGLARLNRVLGQARWATAGHVATAIAAVLITAYTVMMIVMAGFVEPRLGEHPWWDASLALSVVAGIAALAGTVLTAVGLRTSGYLRRTGTVMAVVGGLLLVLNVVAWGAVPPFLPALLWLVIGVAVLRRPVTSPS